MKKHNIPHKISVIRKIPRAFKRFEKKFQMYEQAIAYEKWFVENMLG